MKTKILFAFQTILLVFALCCLHSVFAQAPEKMNFQTVVRDNSNKLVVSKLVGTRISILQGSANGTVVHSETKSEMTNSNGLISTEISTGNLNWATGPYFLKTELDPAGGSDYTISGTTELLSVPYALYAKNSSEAPGNAKGDMKYWDGTNWVLLPAGQPNQVLKVSSTNVPQWQTETSYGGKTYLIIDGNITDAQAATQIANEVGTNTQFIWIQNTTVLTSVDLSMVSQVIELRIENNTALKTINLNGLTTAIVGVEISQNSLLTTLSLPAFTTGGDTDFRRNTALTSLSLPVLTTGDLGIHENNALTSLSLPALTTGDLKLSMNNALTSLSLPAWVTGKIFLHTTSLTMLSLPTWATGDLEIYENAALTTLSLPALTTCDRINFGFNNALTIVSFPVLTSLNDFRCIANMNLTNINIPVLSTYTSSDFSATSCALPSSQINALLAKFVSLGTTPLTNITLFGQTPPAPPTGQGIIDKATLIAAGKSVYTD
jgi:hypothetical protein